MSLLALTHAHGILTKKQKKYDDEPLSSPGPIPLGCRSVNVRTVWLDTSDYPDHQTVTTYSFLETDYPTHDTLQHSKGEMDFLTSSSHRPPIGTLDSTNLANVVKGM